MPEEEMPEEEMPEEEMPEEEMQEPELNPMQVAWGKWNDVRMTYDVHAAVTAPMYDGMEMMPSGSKPDSTYRYTGDIDGTIAPGNDHISDPKITLQVYDNDQNMSIGAEVHWVYGDRPERVTLSKYGARIEEDGTFQSFSMRENGMPVDGNPSGFNGLFYDGGQTYDAVAGFVSTPRVYGPYKAELE